MNFLLLVFFNFCDFCSLVASIFALQLEAVIMERDIVTWGGGVEGRTGWFSAAFQKRLVTIARSMLSRCNI